MPAFHARRSLVLTPALALAALAAPAGAVVVDVDSGRTSSVRNIDDAPATGEFRLTLSGGWDTLQTSAYNQQYVYFDGVDNYPLDVNLQDAVGGPSFRAEGRWGFAQLGSVHLAGGGALSATVASAYSVKGLLLLRAESSDRTELGFFGDIGVGVAIASSSLGTVPTGDNSGSDIMLVEGKGVKKGELITMDGVTSGLEIGGGVMLPLTDKVGVEFRIGLNLWTPINSWSATSTVRTPSEEVEGEEITETVTLGTLNGVPGASLTGVTISTGLVF